MNRKEIKKVMIVFLGIALLAVFKDMENGMLQEDNSIQRGALNESSQETSFRLEIEGMEDTYQYGLEIMPVLVTEKEAKEYFTEAKKEIEETLQVDSTHVKIKESYVDGIVLAEWSFRPFGYVDSNGRIDWESVTDEKIIVHGEVTLTCGTYMEKVEHQILLEKRNASETELLINKIDIILQKQMELEGVDKIQLPEHVDGKNLYWKEEKEYLVVKVVVLEVGMIVLWFVLEKREAEEKKKKQKEKMECEYPDLINQLCILLGAGMTTRQAWIRIAKQYSDKKEKALVEESQLYETIIHMVHRLKEGETERLAYEKFAEEIDVPSFRRLIRALIVNLEKGTAGILAYLEGEEKQAYEIRLLHAKKIGEEASTRMLIPLMLQMILIMAVVLAPAMIGFMN